MLKLIERYGWRGALLGLFLSPVFYFVMPRASTDTTGLVIVGSLIMGAMTGGFLGVMAGIVVGLKTFKEERALVLAVMKKALFWGPILGIVFGTPLSLFQSQQDGKIEAISLPELVVASAVASAVLGGLIGFIAGVVISFNRLKASEQPGLPATDGEVKK